MRHQPNLKFIRLLALLGTLLITRAIAAQVITGIVSDPSNSPIVGATVVARSESASSTTTTAADGRFRLPAPGAEVTVTISAQGFRTSERAWQGSSELLVTLAIAAPNERTTVTALRTEAPLRDTPSTVIVDRTDIQSSGSTAIDDVLRQVPGFTLFRRSGSQTSNPTTQGTSMRGVGASGASRTLVLSDGVPLNDPFGGWIYWARVPREAVDSIEVVRGAESSLYGSDALGGVINIRSLTPRESNLTFETSMANRSTPFASGLASARLGDWIGTIAAEGFTTGGYVPVPEDLRGAVDTTADSEHRSANGSVERLLGESGRAFLNASYFGESRSNGKIDERNSANIRQLSAGTDLHSTRLGSFALRLFGGTEGLRQNFFAVSDDRNSETLTRDQSVPVQQIGLSGQWSRTAGTRQTLLAGIDARWIEGESAEFGFTPAASPSSFLRVGGRQRTTGIFGQDIIRLGSRVLVTLAGRADLWTNTEGFSFLQSLTAPVAPVSTSFADRDETAFSPRISTLIHATDRLSFNAAVYRSFRAPSLNELYRGFRVGNVVTQANPFLKAEYLTGGEAGFGLQANDRTDIRTTFFWNEIDGPVANVTLSATPSLITRQRQNLGMSRSRGVEVEAESRISSRFSLTGGYQFADSTVSEAPAMPELVGKQLPQVPRHEFTFQGRFSDKKLLTGSVQGRFQGTQYDDDRNQLQLERFFVLDAFVSRALSRHMELFAAGENLLNNRYTVGRTPSRTISAPALVRIGVRVQLGSR